MSKTYFMRSGNTYRFASEASVQISERLPVGNYTVKVDMNNGQFFLEMIEAFEPPKKIYGNVLSRTDRILETFMDRQYSTGILLAGEKGSGKTLLSKNLSIEAAKRYNMPTLIINTPLFGEAFNTFIQTLNHEACIIFDEFEKVYADSQQQESLLTLLDGVYPTKKLFILTCNDRYRINDHMINRPGRLYYFLEYSGLTVEFITEYCQDSLNDKSQIDTVISVSALFKDFNFDMLKALVEEMNRYNEPATVAIEMLNVKPSTRNSYQMFNISLIANGTPVAKEKLDGGGEVNLDPLSENGFYVCYFADEENENYVELRFDRENLIRLDGKSGTYEFMTEDGKNKVVLTKQRAKSYNIYDYLV